MDRDALKVWFINGSVLASISIADLEKILSCALIALTIAFTIWKWWHDARKKGEQ